MWKGRGRNWKKMAHGSLQIFGLPFCSFLSPSVVRQTWWPDSHSLMIQDFLSSNSQSTSGMSLERESSLLARTLRMPFVRGGCGWDQGQKWLRVCKLVATEQTRVNAVIATELAQTFHHWKKRRVFWWAGLETLCCFPFPLCYVRLLAWKVHSKCTFTQFSKQKSPKTLF